MPGLNQHCEERNETSVSSFVIFNFLCIFRCYVVRLDCYDLVVFIMVVTYWCNSEAAGPESSSGNNWNLYLSNIFISFCDRLPDVQVPLEPVLHAPHLPVCPTLNALVALEAVLNSNSDVQPFVDQILMLARLMVSIRSKEISLYVAFEL